MLNDPRSHGLWEISAPAAPATSALTQELTVEVAIIGAGYTGLSTALHLAEAGVDCAIVEAVEIGYGGAGRNVGLVNAGMWVMPELVVETMGPQYGPRLIDFLGGGPAHVWEIINRYGIECEATPTGTLHIADGAAGLAEITERARQWQALGAPVELLDKATAARHIGSGYYEGALLDRRAGTIQPLAYARGLAHAAIAQGARIFTAAPATALTRQGDGWRVTTPQGALLARKVVFGTDAYTQGPMQRAIRDQQVILPYFNFATEPLPADIAATILPAREGAWDTNEVLLSFRFDRHNRLVFGSVGALRNTGMAVHSAWAHRALRRIFPQIGKVKFQSAWYGQIGMTQDNLPRFHKLDEGVYTFCGYNGRGIAPGTAFGRFMAAYLRGEKDDSDLPLPPVQSQPVPMRDLRALGYEMGAQLVHMKEARFG